MRRGLVWFKNDLRLHDNEALSAAIDECDELIFCYCVEKTWYNKLDLGFRKADVNRFKFLEQSVLALQCRLEELGSHLIIGDQSASVILPKVIKEFNVSSVYAEQEYASEELSLIDHVKEATPDVQYKFFWGKTLYHMDDIPFAIEKIPLTSKAYRIPTSNKSQPRALFAAPTRLASPENAVSTAFPHYSKYGFTAEEYDMAATFLEGGELKGLERLQYYSFESKLLTGYRWSRNKSQGLDYSSKFSPYLALGCLSPREIYRVVQLYEKEVKKNQSTWWIVFELVWRDYFTFKGMRFGDKIFHTKGFKEKDKGFENNKTLLERWCAGRTGVPFIDAHMRQLNETGFMSNRGRVNCASYFVHDLNIDWTWGAAYFESRLIDYDVSANWLNWHVQAFEIYYTNPIHQSNKYNAQNFIREWIPELGALNDHEMLIPWEFNIDNYPKPVEEYKKWTKSISLIKSKLE